jgi:hypothetical protein
MTGPRIVAASAASQAIVLTFYEPLEQQPASATVEEHQSASFVARAEVIELYSDSFSPAHGPALRRGRARPASRPGLQRGNRALGFSAALTPRPRQEPAKWSDRTNFLSRRPGRGIGYEWPKYRCGQGRK